jgi:hypothetical protein
MQWTALTQRGNDRSIPYQRGAQHSCEQYAQSHARGGAHEYRSKYTLNHPPIATASCTAMTVGIEKCRAARGKQGVSKVTWQREHHNEPVQCSKARTKRHGARTASGRHGADIITRRCVVVADGIDLCSPSIPHSWI